MTKSNLLIDHIGLHLWRAARGWREMLVARMVQEGYDWFDGAPGMLTMHIGPNGIRQKDLMQKTNMSKQAVQQLLDRLESDGVVERRPHPKDKRAKLVCFTQHGLAAFIKANEVKREIEDRYRKQLGSELFHHLQEALHNLNELND